MSQLRDLAAGDIVGHGKKIADMLGVVLNRKFLDTVNEDKACFDIARDSFGACKRCRVA